MQSLLPTSRFENEYVARTDRYHIRCVIALHGSIPSAGSPWTLCLLIPLRRTVYPVNPLAIGEGTGVSGQPLYSLELHSRKLPMPVNRIDAAYQPSPHMPSVICAGALYQRDPPLMTLKTGCLLMSESAPTTNGTTLQS